MLHTLFQTVGAQYSSGNLDAVESTVRTILATVPNDLASLQFLGLVYYRTGRKAEAMRILEMEAPGKDPAPRFEAAPGADFLARNGFSAVAACHVEATHRSRDLALVWYDLGVVLAELGRDESALKAFRTALAACPDYPSAMQLMGSFALDVEASAPARCGSSASEEDEL